MATANPSLNIGGRVSSYTGMMVYPYKRTQRKLPQRLNPGQYIAPPSGATIMPRTPYVKSEWEEAAEQLQMQNSSTNFSSSSSSYIDPAKLVPPFQPGEGDRSLTYLRNDAATKPATRPLQKTLLPYKIRRTAAMSLLHGGVRTTGLNMPYPALAVTHSEQLALPTLQEERRDLKWDAVEFPSYLIPVNMANDFRATARHNRDVDLYRRLQKEMEMNSRKVYAYSSSAENNSTNNSSKQIPAVLFKNKNVRYVQPHSSTLRVEPYSNEEWQQIRAESAEARRNAANLEAGSNNSNNNNNNGQQQEEGVAAPFTQKDAYLPFQSLKPHGYGVWRYTLRNGAPIMAQMDLKQERLNRKGFGWKSLQTKMWQQDLDTHRHMPDVGYFSQRK